MSLTETAGSSPITRSMESPRAFVDYGYNYVDVAAQCHARTSTQVEAFVRKAMP